MNDRGELAVLDGAEQAPLLTAMPMARVNGEAYDTLPLDLYIPPDALRVFLETFEGPLDLLLYLIRRQNLDILNVPLAAITTQYMEYVELMKAFNLELAAEYLVMAAMLAEIKSRMLLPRIVSEDGQLEDDPRADLIRRLQEYERFKQAAEDLEALPRSGRDVFPVENEPPELSYVRPQAVVELKELLLALREVFERAKLVVHHQIHKERLTVRERMSEILARLKTDQFTDFISLFSADEGVPGVVVNFLAVLELVKEKLAELVQNEPYGSIHIRAKSV